MASCQKYQIPPPVKARFVPSMIWIIFLSLGTLFVQAENRQEKKQAKASKGYRLEFFGKDHVLIPKLRYDGSHPITLEALVTPFPRDPEPVRAAVVANLQLSGVGIHYSHKHWLLHVNDGREGNGGYASAVSDDEAELNKPVHVAGVFDGKTVRLFVNGKLQQVTGMTMQKHNPSPFDFMIGGDPDGQGKPHQFFQGIIDEVRISKTARYTKDFTPPKKKFKADDDTLILYHFDEGKGNEAKDASGNGHHGKIEGAEWVKEVETRNEAPGKSEE